MHKFVYTNILYVHTNIYLYVCMSDFFLEICLYANTHIPQACIHLIAYFCQQRSTAYKLTHFQLFIMSDKRKFGGWFYVKFIR